MTSSDSTRRLLASCSLCSALRDSQLNASEPQNRIRSGSDVRLDLWCGVDEKNAHRWVWVATCDV